jgi:hypothetical protein
MMTTKTIDTNTVKQHIDLRELAGRYTELRKASGQKELCGACPKCGGADRFHCTAEWFFCRQCHPKPGDAIEFIMWINNCGFKAAAAILTGVAQSVPATKRAPATKRTTEQTQEWQRNAAALVDAAHRQLFNERSTQADVGRAYLDSRGIESHAWQAFKLGLTPDAPLPGTEGKQRAPAIVIPWYRGGKVVAIRYRFLQWHEYTDSDGKQRKEKQTALNNSLFSGVLFGGQALELSAISLSTLIIVEGELNAASIWQVAKDSRADVLSLGSESAHVTPEMAGHAAQYESVIVWLDTAERAQAVKAAIPGAYPIQSPNGQDGNDLLKTQDLGGFLALHRFQAAKNRHEQERLLWDLWDAAHVWPGADISTNEVTAHIAKVLGVGL